MSKIEIITLNRKNDREYINLELGQSGKMKLVNVDRKMRLMFKNKSYTLHWINWSSDITNSFADMVMTLMEAGYVTVTSGNTIEYVKCPKAKKLIESLKVLTFARLRSFNSPSFLTGISDSELIADDHLLLTKKKYDRTFQMTVLYKHGHQESGSYRYASQAAKVYVDALNRKLKPLKFVWEKYDSSNYDSYSFSFEIKL